MILALSPQGMSELHEVSTPAALNLFHADPTDVIWKNPAWLGSGYVQEIVLSDGLSLVIIDLEFKQAFAKAVSLYRTSLEFEFCLEGVQAGESPILLHFGDEQTWQVQAGDRSLKVEVFVTPPRLESYFHCLQGQFPARAKQISEAFFDRVYRYAFGHSAPTDQLAISQVLTHTALSGVGAAIAQASTEILLPEVWDEFSQSLRSTITPAMHCVIDQILSCPHQGTRRQIYLESRALELITLRLDQVAQLSQSLTQPNLLPSAEVTRICQAKELLLSNLENPPSLTDLARQVGLNDCTLKRGFRQVFGMTAFSCLHHYRMERARQLLEVGELAVGQVASAVGYASRGAFYTAFQKRFGVSPREYMTQHCNHSA